jgi:hypothetical protein
MGKNTLRAHGGSVQASAPDDLPNSYQVVLILRLVLDQELHLRRGELLDAEGVSLGRFLNLKGLTELVSQWLELREPTSNP